MVPLGLAFGRLGNFIGGELWGRLSDVPWAMIFAKSTGFRAGETTALMEAWRSGALDHLARHPSQLYQAGLEGLALFVILMWYSRKPRPAAAVSGLFLIGYGVFRLIAEFFRQPDEHLGFLAMQWLTMGMLLSLPMIAAGFIIMWFARHSDTTDNTGLIQNHENLPAAFAGYPRQGQPQGGQNRHRHHQPVWLPDAF